MAKFSEVLAEAVSDALCDYRDKESTAIDDDLDVEFWRAMYQAQCSATDQFKKLAEVKSPRELTDRIKDLESQLAKVNRNLEQLNMAHLALAMGQQTAA